MSLILRPYKTSDFDAMHALDQECYAPGISYSKRMLRWFLKIPGAICIVAEESGSLVGFILCVVDFPQGHIITIDVAENSRRAGLGTKLLKAAEEAMSVKGARSIDLETATDNATAIAFWHRHGYRTLGVIPRYYLDRVDAYAMHKALAPPKET
jgi:ribosomal protein S18 acetylase RimI-like enzyme